MLFLLIACGPELPEGWEDAEPIEDLTQTPCAGSPYEDHDERIEVDFEADPLEVAYREAHFRCEQEVEGFALETSAGLDMLVQPRDMHPEAVAGCDCLYDIDLRIDVPSPDRVRLYRRWDAQNDPNDPVLIGEVTPD